MGMAEFCGHTSCSLELLFDSMLGNLVEKRKELRSKREVNLDMVEEWWATTTRRKKSSNIKAKEQAIVSAYKKVIESMEREHKFNNLQENFTGEKKKKLHPPFFFFLKKKKKKKKKK